MMDGWIMVLIVLGCVVLAYVFTSLFLGIVLM